MKKTQLFSTLIILCSTPGYAMFPQNDPGQYSSISRVVGVALAATASIASATTTSFLSIIPDIVKNAAKTAFEAYADAAKNGNLQ